MRHVFLNGHGRVDQCHSAVGEFIRDQRRNARLSLRKLSELAGISNPYLSQIEHGLREPSTTVVNAYLRPALRSYLRRLSGLAGEVLVMTSAGGRRERFFASSGEARQSSQSSLRGR